MNMCTIIFQDGGPRWQTCTCQPMPRSKTYGLSELQRRNCYCQSSTSADDNETTRGPRSLRGGMMGGRWFGEDIINWFKDEERWWNNCDSYFCQTWDLGR